MATLADPGPVQMEEDFDEVTGGVPGRRAVDHRAFGHQMGMEATVGAQLAAMNAGVAALQAELFRSLNGLEKVVEKGFEGVGARLDKLETRAGATEQFNAAMNARVEALEERARAEDRRDEADRQATAAERGVLQKESARMNTWQILGVVAIFLVGLLGTIAGIVSAFSG